MPRSRYNQRNPNSSKPLTEKVADDLPKGYLKAGLDLYNGLGDGGKALLLGGLALGAIAYFGNRGKS